MCHLFIGFASSNFSQHIQDKTEAGSEGWRSGAGIESKLHQILEDGSPKRKVGFWMVNGVDGIYTQAKNGNQQEQWTGPKWKEGDVIGMACNLDGGTIHVSVNGVYAGGADFEDVVLGDAFGKWIFPFISNVKYRSMTGFDWGADVTMKMGYNYGQKSFKYDPPVSPPLYPGEVGDRFRKTVVVLLLTAGEGSASVKLTDKCLTALLTERPNDAIAFLNSLVEHRVLQSEEERARGAEVLPQSVCLEWDARYARVLALPAKDLEAEVTAAERRHAGAGTTLVGVVLPMPPALAQARVAGLLAAVAEVMGLPNCMEDGFEDVRVVRMWAQTTVYCAVPSLADLRRRLGELSNAELRAAARNDWAVATADDEPRAVVVAAAVDAFVRQELQVDFAVALACAFTSADAVDGATRLDAALGPLLWRWTASRDSAEPPPPPAPSEQQDSPWDSRIAAATARLDSEKRWAEVQEWVGLHRVRMQGRTRKGLKMLIQRETDKIGQCGLKEEEVLALHLCTGASPWPIPYLRLPLLQGNDDKTLACGGGGEGRRSRDCADEQHLLQLPACHAQAARGRWDAAQ